MTPEDVVELANNAMYVILRQEDGLIKEFDFASTRAEAYRIQERMEQWPGATAIMSREDA